MKQYKLNKVTCAITIFIACMVSAVASAATFTGSGNTATSGGTWSATVTTDDTTGSFQLLGANVISWEFTFSAPSPLAGSTVFNSTNITRNTNPWVATVDATNTTMTFSGGGGFFVDNNLATEIIYDEGSGTHVFKASNKFERIPNGFTLTTDTPIFQSISFNPMTDVGGDNSISNKAPATLCYLTNNVPYCFNNDITEDYINLDLAGDGALTPFLAVLPDESPSGNAFPAVFYSFAKTVSSPSVPPIITCSTPNNGNPTQELYRTTVTLGDGESCAITVTPQANGDTYADVVYTGTLSRSGNVYYLTNGEICWGSYSTCVTPTPAPISQTITFNPTTTGTYGGKQTLSATASSSLAVTFASTTTSVCTVSGTTLNYIAAGTCTVTADQAGDATYAAAPQVSKNITVAKADQTISFTPPGSGAPGTNATLSATATSSATVTFASTTTSVCTVSGTTVNYLIGGLCTITADQAGNANYNAAPQVSGNVTVAKIDQSITFNPPASGTYLGNSSLSATGGASGNAVTFASTTTSICTVTGTTVNYVAVGGCTLTADQTGNASYNPAPQVTKNITVNKADQAITFNPPASGSYLGNASLSATGGASGNTVTFASTTPANCTVSGTSVNYTGAGTCTVTADQAGNGSYNAAPQVTKNITVNKANQLVNTSIRCDVDTGNAMAITGFVITGTGEKTVLIRAMRTASLSPADYDLRLDLMRRENDNSWTTVVVNDNWQNGLNAATISALPSNLQLRDTRDAAILTTLSPGVYTALAQPNGSSGIGVLGLDDLDDPTTSTTQLVNFSGRCVVGDGLSNAVMGFVVEGSGTLNLALRGMIAAAMSHPDFDPAMDLYQISNAVPTLIDHNDNDDAAVFGALQPNLRLRDSRDAGLLAGLPAGAYTLNLYPATGIPGVGVLGVDIMSEP